MLPGVGQDDEEGLWKKKSYIFFLISQYKYLMIEIKYVISFKLKGLFLLLTCEDVSLIFLIIYSKIFIFCWTCEMYCKIVQLYFNIGVYT